MLPTVRISDIGLFMRCPRLLYFEPMEPRPPDPLQLLIRGLMLGISGTDGDGLEARIEKLSQEILIIYRGQIDPQEISIAIHEMEPIMPELSQYISSSDQLLPSDVEVDLRSDRLVLSGRLDRLVAGTIPSLIRTGKAPENGAWKTDRLKLAGYAILLEEMLDKRIEYGLVEYPRSGVIRKVSIRSIDRSRVLRARDSILKIKKGWLPDRPGQADCQRCPALERCESKCSLMSKLF
ncbi:MAG TPA: hypothetical protein VN455_12625 [Methanotrichaceae archaeon]|nr:hypothetical protein [Methanotrichaceae archaeon]